MKSFDEFCVENCKSLIEEYPCQNKKQLERKKVDILKMIRTVSTDVLLVGLEWKIAAAQESITFNSLKTSIENAEKYTENNKQHHENKITAS